MKTTTNMLDDSPKVLRTEALEAGADRFPPAHLGALRTAGAPFSDALVLAAGEPDPWGFGVQEAA